MKPNAPTLTFSRTRFRESQGAPERARESQREREKARERQGEPERARESERAPERTQEVPTFIEELRARLVSENVMKSISFGVLRMRRTPL